MSYLGAPIAVRGLPAGYGCRTPDERDVPDVVALLSANRSPGDKPVDVEGLTANLIGLGSWTRRQVVVSDPAGRLLAWAVVHDRAAGRTNVELTVAPGPADSDVARALLSWVEATAGVVARLRGQPRTQLDATATAVDVRQQTWLAAAARRLRRRPPRPSRG